MACVGGLNGAYAIDVEKGSTLTIAGNTTALPISGNVLNNGKLIVTKDGGLEIKHPFENKGEMVLGVYNENKKEWDTGKLTISSTFVNFGTGTLAVTKNSLLEVTGVSSEGSFTNEGKTDLQEGGSINVSDTFVNGGDIDIWKDAKLEVGGAFTNGKEIDVNQKGTLKVGGELTNTDRLTVKSWTIPTNGEEDGGTLIANSAADGVVNTGTLEFGEGGIFKTESSSVTVTNSGIFRIADPKFFQGSISLKDAGDVDPESGVSSAKFQLTNITDDLIEDLPEIAYTGENQYKDIFPLCKYKKQWEWPADKSIVFDVIGTDWSYDIYLDENGTQSADRNVEDPDEYWVVYSSTKRRNTPVKKSFTMLPASMTIRFTNPSPVDPPCPGRR